nr:unnamed protein product [Digitaria exilis]CAB3479597.1 unnamed protein product [Digitaria exilis]
MLKALPAQFLASPEAGEWRRRPRRRSLRPISAALMTNPAYFEVGRFLGGYGFMNITRLYEGRVVQGPLRGTQAVFKVYPGARAGASEADLMALNELRTHAFLQSDASGICDNIQFLLGAFETSTGEQADDRLSEAVNFLDLGDGAGWELLQAMLHPDYRKRPMAEAVLRNY